MTLRATPAHGREVPADQQACPAATGEAPVVRMLTDDRPAALRARARAMCTTTPDGWTVHWSRSYCGSLAVVAGWGGRVGVDVEGAAHPVSPRRPHNGQDPVAALAGTIATPDERAALALVPAAHRWRTLVDWWSAKEALAKALGDALVHEPRHLPTPARWPGGGAGRWRAEPLDLTGAPASAVGWVVWEVDDPAVGADVGPNDGRHHPDRATTGAGGKPGRGPTDPGVSD